MSEKVVAVSSVCQVIITYLIGAFWVNRGRYSRVSELYLLQSHVFVAILLVIFVGVDKLFCRKPNAIKPCSWSFKKVNQVSRMSQSFKKN